MSSDSFQSFRSMVSRVYRLSMMIASQRHEQAADLFDSLMDEFAHLAFQGQGPSSHIQELPKALDAFLERDTLSATPPFHPSTPEACPTPIRTPTSEPNVHCIRLVIHEQAEEAVETEETEEELGCLTYEEEEEVEEEEGEEELVTVEKVSTISVQPTQEVVDSKVVEVEETEEEVLEMEETEEAEVEVEETEETEEVEVEVEETEETEEVEVEVEETEEVEVEETEEVEVETEEVEVEETEEEVLEMEETEETEEVEVEVEETEEVEVEETEEVEVEETEEVEVEETEETEEEEGSYEPIKIGKSMYFLDTSTQNVFAYISDEEAGDYVGKLVNGKLVRN